MWPICWNNQKRNLNDYYVNDLVGKVSMHEQSGFFNKEMETKRETQIEMLQTKFLGRDTEYLHSVFQ